MLKLNYQLRSFCSSLEFATEALINRLSQRKPPYNLQIQNLVDLGLDINHAKMVQKKMKNPEQKKLLLQNINSCTHEEGRILYCPTGLILNADFLEWAAGCFDGDGCVSTHKQNQSPVIQMGQKSKYLKLFHAAFGGIFYQYNKVNMWKMYGLPCYFFAQKVKDYAIKKKPELQDVISYFENDLSHLAFKENILQHKSQYHCITIDIEKSSYATIAGWIDSDGSISIKRNSHSGISFYPRVVISQDNESLCRSFAKRFGGRAYNSRVRTTSWRVDINGKAALDMLKKVHPHLIHKKDHAKLLLETKNIDGHTYKIMFALNTRIVSPVYRKFVQRYSETPDDFLKSIYQDNLEK